MKNLCPFLALLLLLSACSAHENLALRGVATQSHRALDSTAAASNAIDGNRNSDIYAGSCASSTLEHSPWWKVDLLATYVITSINITNRGDCCAERLNGLEIYVDDRQVGTIASFGLAESVSHVLNFRTEGREVKLVLPGDDRVLVLCEVEVTGYPAERDVIHPLLGRATQSSLFDYRSHASNAIDGNHDSTWENGACSCTTDEKNPWWRMDLLKTHKVFFVKVTSRADTLSKYLDGAEIRVGDSLYNNGLGNTRCGVIHSINTSQTLEFQCGNGMDGQFVTISLPGQTGVLSMCEVEVLGNALS